MAIWDFSDYSYQDLLGRQIKMEDLDIVEGSQDDDEFRELEAEIDRRKEEGYQYIVVFSAINNDTYDESDKVLGLYDEPDDITRRVRDTYDGVWEPVLETIRLYELKEIKIPAK